MEGDGLRGLLTCGDVMWFLSPPGMQLPAENGPGGMCAGMYVH